MTLDHTHHPDARSWLDSANAAGGDFPIQNLPFCVFRRRGTLMPFRVGVGIGDQMLDLTGLASTPLLDSLARSALKACVHPVLDRLLAMGHLSWRALRHGLFGLLQADAPDEVIRQVRLCLLPQREAEFARPTSLPNYTDFYTSIHHARTVHGIARPGTPMPPNFQRLPIAYHGRASSVVVSGTAFHRPMGQAMPPGADAPVFGPCRRLDYELELGFWIGPGNALGEPVPLDRAEAQLFGVSLLNDWSARDHQFWEMTPLGPFLGKNFCTSVSPWVVTLDALAPYRVRHERPAGDPSPLPYLDSAHNREHGGLDVQLEVWLESTQHRARGLPPDRISATRFRHQYWTAAQMVTQHTVGGCNLQPGDLIGTGTISGPTPAEGGALVELSLGGTRTLDLPGTGEQRRFLEDGDNVILRGWCEKPGAARIGFGQCEGLVLPAAGH